MEHSYPLVETIVGGLVFAFILGMVAQRLRMPPLIGYLFAGIIVGPYGPDIPGMQGIPPQAELLPCRPAVVSAEIY